VNTPRGLVAVCILAIPLLVLRVIGRVEYWLSASFATLFVGQQMQKKQAAAVR